MAAQKGIMYTIGALIIVSVLGSLGTQISGLTTGTGVFAGADFAAVKAILLLVPIGIVVAILIAGFYAVKKRI